MPAIRLKVRPVMSSQPPQTMYAARRVSVRGIRPRAQRPTTSRISALGMSQEIWPPISALNIRVSPVAPHMLPAVLPPPPPPTDPTSLPVIRPSPL